MRDALRDVWAKAEDEKQSVIATDVNANIPKLLEGKGDGQLMAAMDQMSIKGGEDGQAKAPLCGSSCQFGEGFLFVPVYCTMPQCCSKIRDGKKVSKDFRTATRAPSSRVSSPN